MHHKCGKLSLVLQIGTTEALCLYCRDRQRFSLVDTKSLWMCPNRRVWPNKMTRERPPCDPFAGLDPYKAWRLPREEHGYLAPSQLPTQHHTPCLVSPVYPTEASAKKAVAALRANINAETPRTQLEAMSFAVLEQHYREKELSEDSGKTFATIRTNEGHLDKWIRPRWSTYRLKDIKAVSVEEWLRSLPLANGSRAKIRNLMHAIFNHAVRWEMARQESDHARAAER